MATLFDSFDLIFYAGGYLQTTPGTNFVIKPYNNTSNFYYNSGSESYGIYGSIFSNKIRVSPDRVLVSQSSAQSPFTIRNDYGFSDIGSILLEADSTMLTLTNPGSSTITLLTNVNTTSSFTSNITASGFWNGFTMSGSSPVNNYLRRRGAIFMSETTTTWKQYITSSVFPRSASLLMSCYISGSDMWQPGITHSNQLLAFSMAPDTFRIGNIVQGIYRVDQQRIASSSEYSYSNTTWQSAYSGSALFFNIIPQPSGISKVTMGGFSNNDSFTGGGLAAETRILNTPSGSNSLAPLFPTSSAYQNQPKFFFGGIQTEKIVDELNISMSFNTASFIGSSLIINKQTTGTAPSIYTTRFSDKFYNTMSDVYTKTNQGSLVLRYTTNPFWTNYGTSSIQFLIDSGSGDSLVHLRNNRIEYKTTASTYEFIDITNYPGINPAITPKYLGDVSNNNTKPIYCYTLETGSFVNLGISWSDNTLRIVANSGSIIEVNNFTSSFTPTLDFEPVLPLSQMRIQWVFASSTQVTNSILRLATTQSLR